ncbi:hypothetical protein GCM10009583_34330 [Ornithinicoccus hortensis]
MLQLLRETPPGELDALLAEVELTDLIRGLDDRRMFGPDHRSALLDLLCRERRAELTLERLADLVHALHHGRTPASHERAVRDVFLSLQGAELATLKNLVNAHGDYHDLDHLIFEDIDDDDVREEILEHIARQAAGQQSPDLKILSDIDDTVISMLHDRRFPRGVVYPGVVEFLCALDHGAAAEPGRPGDLTFLTARPSDAAGVVDSYTRNGLSGHGLPPHSVMTGSILNLLTKGRIAQRKLVNFDRYRLLFPECAVVFLGDSGQADVRVGQAMLERDPDHVRAVFIHDVAGTDPRDRERLAGTGVYLFDTYAGAAAHALRLDLISSAAARQVRDAVRAGVAAADLQTTQRATVERHVAQDEALLAAAGVPA